MYIFVHLFGLNVYKTLLIVVYKKKNTNEKKTNKFCRVVLFLFANIGSTKAVFTS